MKFKNIIYPFILILLSNCKIYNREVEVSVYRCFLPKDTLTITLYSLSKKYSIVKKLVVTKLDKVLEMRRPQRSDTVFSIPLSTENSYILSLNNNFCHINDTIYFNLLENTKKIIISYEQKGMSIDDSLIFAHINNSIIPKNEMKQFKIKHTNLKDTIYLDEDFGEFRE